MPEDITLACGENLVLYDGHRLRVLRNEGTRECPRLAVEEERDAPDANANASDFARSIAHDLATAVDHGSMRSIVLAGPADALSSLDRALPAPLRTAVRARVTSNFLARPLAELDDFFRFNDEA